VAAPSGEHVLFDGQQHGRAFGAGLLSMHRARFELAPIPWSVGRRAAFTRECELPTHYQGHDREVMSVHLCVQTRFKFLDLSIPVTLFPNLMLEFVPIHSHTPRDRHVHGLWTGSWDNRNGRNIHSRRNVKLTSGITPSGPELAKLIAA
jgi:hypothetical protein